MAAVADQQENGHENKRASAGRASLDRLLRDVAGRSARYLDGLGGRAVLPSHEALVRAGELLGALPDDGEDPEMLIEMLDEIAGPATVATAGPCYFGFVTGAHFRRRWPPTGWPEPGTRTAFSASAHPWRPPWRTV